MEQNIWIGLGKNIDFSFKEQQRTFLTKLFAPLGIAELPNLEKVLKK
jgi:hypothetical protein